MHDVKIMNGFQCIDYLYNVNRRYHYSPVLRSSRYHSLGNAHLEHFAVSESVDRDHHHLQAPSQYYIISFNIYFCSLTIRLGRTHRQRPLCKCWYMDAWLMRGCGPHWLHWTSLCHQVIPCSLSSMRNLSHQLSCLHGTLKSKSPHL